VEWRGSCRLMEMQRLSCEEALIVNRCRDKTLQTRRMSSWRDLAGPPSTCTHVCTLRRTLRVQLRGAAQEFRKCRHYTNTDEKRRSFVAHAYNHLTMFSLQHQSVLDALDCFVSLLCNGGPLRTAPSVRPFACLSLKPWLHVQFIACNLLLQGC